MNDNMNATYYGNTDRTMARTFVTTVDPKESAAKMEELTTDRLNILGVVSGACSRIEKTGQTMTEEDLKKLETRKSKPVKFSANARPEVVKMLNKINNVVNPIVASANELCSVVSMATEKQVADTLTFAEKQRFVKENLVAAKEKIASNKEEASRVVGLQQTVTEQQSTINALQQEKTDLENANQAVKTRLEEVEGEINAKQAQIDQLTQEKTALETAKNQAEEKLQKADETIGLATEALRQTAGLIAAITGRQLPDDAGFDALKAFFDANINAAKWQVEIYKQQQAKVENLEEELKKVNSEKEDLKNQIDAADRGHSEFGEHENQTEQDTTVILQDSQNKGKPDSKDDENGKFLTPVVRQLSAASIRPGEENKIGWENLVAVAKIDTNRLKKLFDSNTMQSCNAKSFENFETKVIGSGNESVSKKKAEVDANITYLEKVIESFIQTFEGATLYAAKKTLSKEEQSRKNTVESFGENMQGLLNAVKNSGISNAERWMLLHFQLECAYQELNSVASSIKKYKIKLPESGSYSVAETFKALGKAGYLK